MPPAGVTRMGISPPSPDARRRRELAEQARADDALSHRLPAEVAAPAAAVGPQRPAAAVDVLGVVDGGLDGALPVRDLRPRGARQRAVVLDVLAHDGACR